MSASTDCESIEDRLLFEPSLNSRVYRSRVNAGTFVFPILHELAATAAIRRLRNIGFLGAIEFLQYGNGEEPHRRRHNRYDHSIGVAQLALAFAKERGVDEKTTKTLVAAALLHDVGHGPLSHTLEPVFEEAFGLSHHKVGDALITGALPLGKCIPAVLRANGVDTDEVLALLNGKASNEYAFLFSSPMNLDTLEGITRSRYFATSWSASPPATLIVRALARETPTATLLDGFWELKDAVYKVLIHSRTGLVMDATAQAFMRDRIADFHPSDFYRDERQLRRRHPALFSILNSAKSIYALVAGLPSKLLEQTVDAKERHFFVDKSVALTDSSSWINRYRQTKSGRKTSLGALIPSRLNPEMRYQRDAQMELMDDRSKRSRRRQRAL